MESSGEQPVRGAFSRPEIDEWALVLSASRIPYSVHREDGRWVLSVAREDHLRAADALAAYDSESRAWAEVAPVPREYGRSYGGVAIALALVLAYWITGAGDTGSPWFRLGSLSAWRVLDGELWRTVTALTLHLDVTHIASNAAATLLFGTALCQALGPGVAVWLMLLAGAGGNALDAVLRGPGQVSVGASTAIFGAVGGLGALRFMSRYRFASTRRSAWLPVAAALALLAMFGGGDPQTDIVAHLFGFLVGLGLGAAVAVAFPRPPAMVTQLLLFAAAIVAVAGCWSVAFRH